jgi:hypothetical protein
MVSTAASLDVSKHIYGEGEKKKHKLYRKQLNIGQ